MQYRPLGLSGIDVSAIGFGAWGIGGRTRGATSYGATDDAVSRQALEAAFDHGITFFDTANVYGDGHSEALIGETFKSRRGQIVIASKAGMTSSYSGFDFAPTALRASLEGSLRRLQTDYLDVLQLHNPTPSNVLESAELLRALEDFRAEGKIRAFGFSTKSPTEAMQLLATPNLGCLQVNLNLLDWRAISNGLVKRALQCGVGLIARTPLAFGFLTGAIKSNQNFPEDDHRSSWSSGKVQLWVEAAEAIFGAIQERNAESRSQLAIRFCLSFDAVASAIPGILTPSEVEKNVLINFTPLAPEALLRIKDAYDRYEPALAKV